MSSITVPPYRIDNLYRSELLQIIQTEIDSHERSAQQLVGPSEIGGCERKLAFKVAYGAANSGPGGWAAHKGTVLHAWLADTFSDEELRMPNGSPRFLTEIAMDQSSLNVSGGTCDLYDRLHEAVVDWKLPGSFSMDKVRNRQVNEGYYVQANVYGYHLSRMGHPVSTVSLAFLPMAGDDLHSDRGGAIFCTWDYDEAVARAAIGNVDRIHTMLTIAESRGIPASKVIMAQEARSDFCSSCPAFVGSLDRRGTCPGADIRVPQRDPSNPFG